MTRYLPKWKDEWSDGCSHVSDIARPCCVQHDEAYYYGGSKEDRAKADYAFLKCMIAFGIPRWRAYLRYYGVRAFGGPENKEKRVSWSFGGEFFAYDDQPALPIQGKP